MQNSLFCGLVQRTDGVHDRVFGFGRSCRKGFARGVIGSAGGATDVAVAQTTLLFLTIAFDLGLNVSQVFLRKFLALLYDSATFYMTG